MRLGAPIFEPFTDPDTWIAAVQRRGYRAAYCPLQPDADSTTIRAYSRAAEQADIVIAEVGAWSNPLSPDATTRAAAIAKSCHAKDILLADRLTVHLDETRPGLPALAPPSGPGGGLDYRTLLRELDALGPDLPLMLEHLPTAADYDLAASHVRAAAREVGVRL